MPAGLPDTQGMRRPRAFTFHVRRASSLGSSCGRTCFHAANKVTAKARVLPVCSSRTKVMFVRACAHFLAFGECASCWTWPYTAKRLPGEHAAADNSWPCKVTPHSHRRPTALDPVFTPAHCSSALVLIFTRSFCLCRLVFERCLTCVSGCHFSTYSRYVYIEPYCCPSFFNANYPCILILVTPAKTRWKWTQ